MFDWRLPKDLLSKVVPLRSRDARLLVLLLLLAFSLLAPTVQAAQPRAWLDRDQIALGETATLNIETDQVAVDAPDYSPLLSDFRVSGNTSSRSFQSVNGNSQARTLFAVALQPRHDGVIGIPGLLVGGQRTQPLTLTVAPASAAPAPAQAGDVVFIQAQVDARQPYVQQAVGYTVRLYAATPLLSGQLDQATPDGASLQRVGDDVQYNREMAGRRYNVIERHYLLIPEHSGTLTIPAAQFQGRGTGGFFDDFFGDGQRDLHASGPAQSLQVHAIPDQAPQPWLPLRSLQLRYAGMPQDARAGQAFTVTVEVTADGATAAQLPELQLPAIDGAQVFADPPQSDDTFSDGRPKVRLTRRFSVVPSQAGTLHLRGPRMDWWDVGAGARRSTTLPDLDVQVAPGVGGAGASSPAGSAPVAATTARNDDGDWMHVPGVQGEVRPWAFATAVFALLWLITFMWGLHRHPHPQPSSQDKPGPKPAAHASPRGSAAQLKRALDSGSLDDVEASLCAMASPPVADGDALRGRLRDQAQRDAIALLQRARWGDGDGVAARAALRAAFGRGPDWLPTPASRESPLPPLYPKG